VINAQRQILRPLSFKFRKLGDKRVGTSLRPLSFKNSNSRGGRRQIMVIPRTFSTSRGNRVRWHAKTNYGHSVSRRPSSIVSNKTQRQIMVILRLVSTERKKFDSIRKMCQYWSFSNFCRFRWQGGSLAKWCFAWTKLVSYLYFLFISNKRQLKKGNCHTLISSGDHPLLGCDPHLTTSRYLAPIVRKFVKFRDMPELKGSVSAQSVKFCNVPEGKKRDDYVIRKVS